MFAGLAEFFSNDKPIDLEKQFNFLSKEELDKFRGNDWKIDRSKEYPSQYEEFMSGYDTWDLYGDSRTFLGMETMMTEKEVTKIIENRQARFLARRAREIKKLEKKLENELKSWKNLRDLGEQEVDITDISQARPNFSDPIKD